jgi:hypothetical protein
MANVAFTLDGLDDLKRLQGFISYATLEKAQRGGILYASKAVPPAVAKGIRASYNIKSQRIKQDISKVTIDPTGESATIRFSRRPPTLIQYGAKPGTRAKGQPGLGQGRGWGPATRPGKPLTANIIRAQGRKPIAGAFIARGNSGNQVVLRRNSQGRLFAVYGPSIGSIFLGRSAISTDLQATVRNRINEQFIKGYERALSAAARGR